MSAATQVQTLYRSTRISRLVVVLACLVLALLALVLLGLMLGIPQLSLSELITVVQGGGSRLARIVVPELRLPRVVLGALVGAMLALAGTLFQDSMRNPLAGPGLIGVSSGASFVMAAGWATPYDLCSWACPLVPS
jgi:iron complex transport system permease protein